MQWDKEVTKHGVDPGAMEKGGEREGWGGVSSGEAIAPPEVKDGVNYHEGSSQEYSSKLWVKILGGRQMDEEGQSLEEILGTGHVTSATPNTFIHSYKALSYGSRTDTSETCCVIPKTGTNLPSLP